jgi:hypothetical protein
VFEVTWKILFTAFEVAGALTYERLTMADANERDKEAIENRVGRCSIERKKKKEVQ